MSRTHGVRGFTLIEILVSMAIIGVLVSLLLPALRSAVDMARSRQCQSGQRSVGFDFSIFADESLHGYRGSDARAGAFTMSSFIDAQYQVGDFWAWPGQDEVQLGELAGQDPMRCPEMRSPLVLTRGRQAFEGAVAPLENISFGFNVRLHQIEVLDSGGRPRAQRVRLTSAVLEHPNVPLMWDIDPQVAAEHEMNPLLSGPSLNSPGVFANDRYWFPGRRHHGKGNFLFIDGHVAESGAPVEETGWEWGFTPPAR